MKKLITLVAILIMGTMSFPFHFLASENGEVPNGNEYNDLGIKKGTMVYGEDISKLTKEELQYIPEGWRDGVIESERQNSESRTISSTIKASYPNVNDYIYANKLATSKIEYDHKSVLPIFPYRYGHPEGVVAHETANSSSTIENEVAYMTGHYQNAFVHAYVDDSNVIEVHPTNYGAWGAGHFANERFIHVELVRVHSFDKFARSINNYAAYISSLLYAYDLDVVSAENTGKGTLWSHKAVSKFLGGTTHQDPHGYFAQWGYNWDEFVELVNKKYNQINDIKKQATSKLGHIDSSDVRIYQDLSNLTDYVTAGSEYSNQVYYIKQQAVSNGDTYYLISLKPSSKVGTVGWIKAEDMTVYSHVGVDYDSKQFIISGDGVAYDRAWGDTKNLVYNDLSPLAGETFDVNLTEKVGNNVWYRGYLAGKQVWIHSDHLEEPIRKQATSKLGHIDSSDVRIYQDLSNLKDYAAAGSKYANQVYYIKQQAVASGDTYYLISLEPSSKVGTVGWIKAEDMTVYPHVGVDYDSKSFIISGDGMAYNRAWGDTKNLVYNDLSPLAGETFDVNLTEKVGNNIWYRGHLAGKQVWIDSSHVEEEEAPTIDEVPKVNFTDVPEGSSHHDAIYALVEMGAISGYQDNTYQLGEKITRSQTAAIFTRALELPIPNNLQMILENYSDVDVSDYYAEQIAATYQAGIFRGSEGKFMDGPLTREQMATVIVEAYNLKDTGVNVGIRLDNVSPSHRENVAILAQHGITNQFEDFGPTDKITRGQFATFVYKAMQN